MNKYIIYQGSGGLVHMLGGLVYCCEYINKKKDYLLIIDIKNHDAFSNYFSKYFILNGINYTEDYSEIKGSDNYHKITLDYLNKTNVKYDNEYGYIHKYNYNNKIININIGKALERIDYYRNIKMYAGHGGNNRHTILKYIKCNDDIKQKLKEYKIDEKYVGVHFRNTDRSNDINIFINKLKFYKDYKIYIATDDFNALYIFKNELKDYNIFYYFEPYNAHGENIHFNDPDKDKIVMSILVDMYMLYHCDIFIDSPNSLVSKLVNYMRISKESIFE